MVAKLLDNVLEKKHTIDDVAKMAADLCECSCICERHKRYILTEKMPMERNRLLVEVLTRISVEHYKIFLERLSIKQHYLADMLQVDSTG